MKTLYLDATAGIAGDMTVAALLDLGLPFAYLQQQLAALKLSKDEFSLSVAQVERRGVRGCHFEVRLADHPHGHHHANHHHHRSYADIRGMIAASALPDRTQQLAQKIFLKLAQAEAVAHQVAVDEVHFHEVGAVDSIVDIVGTAIGLDWLGVERIFVSAVPLGGGFVETAHGRLPVPTPATAELLKGLAVHGHCGIGERVTPTGAAILASLAQSATAMPEMTVERVGHGAGSKDFGDCPNVLRAFLGTPAENHERVVEVRCNLDDVTSEVLGYTQERLFEAGAMDVWCTGIQMKKNRPGVLLSFLCAPEQAAGLSALLMAETGALGVRTQALERIVAERRIEEHSTPWGMVRCKRGPYGLKAEYEDCRRIAREQGIPLRVVQQRTIDGAADE